MDPIDGSETSAFRTQTPGNYPKENILHVVIFSELINNIRYFIVGSASHPSHGSSSPTSACGGKGWSKRDIVTQGATTAVGVWI